VAGAAVSAVLVEAEAVNLYDNIVDGTVRPTDVIALTTAIKGY